MEANDREVFPLAEKGARINILHVDDDRAFREVFQELIEGILDLARGGHSVDATELLGLTSGGTWSRVMAEDAERLVDDKGGIIAGERKLKQLLENLFRNAVDHGGDEVTVRVGALTDGFVVEDDGPGIPVPERARVFERGYSTATDGIGFGLSIVAEIIAAHGWEITATDAETGGVRFEITGVEMTPD